MSDNGEKAEERKANDHQVGGDHYRSTVGEQHWDRLVRRYGLEKAFIWFVGNITAYVERYRDKNGVEDLRKARHYLDKLIELEEEAEATSKGEREKARKASNQPTKEKEEVS